MTELQVYRKALRLIRSGERSFMCHAIAKAADEICLLLDWDRFPVFMSLKPDSEQVPFNSWFDESVEADRPWRVIVLQECIEICKQQKNGR